MVLRACGRSAGGTASLSLARRPGRQRDSSLATAFSASFMRQRIFLGFVSILILFVGIGAYSFWLFSRVGVGAHATRSIFVLWVAGVGIVLSIYFATQRAIFKPIQSLTAVAKELGNGNLDQVVPVQSNDEIGALAAAFNKLAAKLRAYRQITANQILQARQMTEITFSAFPDAILALSVDGRINFANPAAEELLKSLGSQDGLPLRIREEAENVLKGATDYTPTSFEKAVPVLVNEREAYLLPRVIGMRDESGKLFGAALVLQDVTRFRLMDEVKNNLVSTVSHELKTPLSSIRMGLHLLLEEKIGTLNPKQLELLLAAREDSERLLRMINDLLDLARLESGQTRQHFEIVSPGTEDSTGVGLGLPIAKEMVVSHGGSIGLQSTSGQRSEFYFDLPAISKRAKA
jgi:signal transduction histidine kinase